ncbi:hypothetical protein EVAR_51400_1 [Eumeta japonica]|uniref:Uncharacterized protein n=1 Tax=Eumeta variegata TaxID=151549 RepID=A0A4C1ZVR4_EUMVA|nr:hypothetical protein EVAR_51400_1 [Eumeta japonica]
MSAPEGPGLGSCVASSAKINMSIGVAMINLEHCSASLISFAVRLAMPVLRRIAFNDTSVPPPPASRPTRRRGARTAPPHYEPSRRGPALPPGTNIACTTVIR